MKPFLIRRWFLLSLTAVMAAGIAFWMPLKQAFDWLPSGWNSAVIATVMFLMALPLDAHAIGQAIRRPTAACLGVATNFGIAPLAAWAIAPVLALWSSDLGNGLLIAAAAPTTVASAAIWTRRAGGNDAVAVLVTMITNLSCFAVTPAILWITARADVDDRQFQPGPMMLRLGLIVAAPLLLAQGARQVPRVQAWSARRKTPLGVACQLGVLTMVLTGVVQCGEKLQGVGAQEISWIGWAVTVAAVLIVHLAALVAGQAIAAGLGLPREDRIAVGFAGSQKTLLVGLGIAISYANVFGPLAVLPMVVYHVTQLLVDTVIADRLRPRGDAV